MERVNEWVAKPLGHKGTFILRLDRFWQHLSLLILLIQSPARLQAAAAWYDLQLPKWSRGPGSHHMWSWISCVWCLSLASSHPTAVPAGGLESSHGRNMQIFFKGTSFALQWWSERDVLLKRVLLKGRRVQGGIGLEQCSWAGNYNARKWPMALISQSFTEAMKLYFMYAGKGIQQPILWHFLCTAIQWCSSDAFMWHFFQIW